MKNCPLCEALRRLDRMEIGQKILKEKLAELAENKHPPEKKGK